MYRDEFDAEAVAGGAWAYALGMIAWSVVIALVVCHAIGIDVAAMLCPVC